MLCYFLFPELHIITYVALDREHGNFRAAILTDKVVFVSAINDR